MKRMIGLLMVLGLVVGCGGDSDSPTGPTKGPEGQTLEIMINNDDDGRIEREYQYYRDGNGNIVKHGWYKEYSDPQDEPQGWARLEAIYVNSKLEGKMVLYDADGNKIDEDIWKDGKCVSLCEGDYVERVNEEIDEYVEEDGEEVEVGDIVTAEPDGGTAHAEAFGLAIISSGAEIVRYENGLVSGQIDVGRGNETSLLSVRFIAEDGELLNPDPAGDWSLAWEVADESVASVEQRAEDGAWNFRIVWLEEGQTTVIFKIIHGDHFDFVSKEILIDVQDVIPSAYLFDSRFNDGESSVSYSGQVVRNLLLQDLSSLIGDLAKDGAEAISEQDLLNLYDYEDALHLESRTTAGSTPIAESYYSSISTGKNLSGKISSDLVIGYGKTADELVREWFAIISDNSQDAGKLGTPAVYTTDEGVDLNQMANKVLIGAVPYYQATGVDMDFLFNKDNFQPRKIGNASTAMEHAWDQAFGYFGAARDYVRYSDHQLAGSSSDFTFDSNGDGYIDLNSEYNFGLSRNAGKRDKGGTGVDFTGETFTAFLTGRALISYGGSITEIAAQRQAAANGIEKVIAATVIHYINDTLADMADLGTANENIPNLNKHWAAMKGSAVALQYNPFSWISPNQLGELHGIFGEAPTYDARGSDAYETTLQNYGRAKDVLQDAYGFSSANIENW